VAKTPQSIRPPLQADPSGGTPCRVPPCPGTPDPTHSQKGDHDDQVASHTPALSLTLALTLPLTLVLLASVRVPCGSHHGVQDLRPLSRP